MTLKEKIQADKVSAIKEGNKQLNTLLGTVLGELDRVGKNPSDDETTRIVKKMVENMRMCNDFHEANHLEETYLPKMMTEEEIRITIEKYCADEKLTEKKSMGQVMKYMKETFGATYDGKIASQIVTKILK